MWYVYDNSIIIGCNADAKKQRQEGEVKTLQAIAELSFYQLLFKISSVHLLKSLFNGKARKCGRILESYNADWVGQVR